MFDKDMDKTLWLTFPGPPCMCMRYIWLHFYISETVNDKLRGAVRSFWTYRLLSPLPSWSSSIRKFLV